jgi:hypothetical protein
MSGPVLTQPGPRPNLIIVLPEDFRNPLVSELLTGFISSAEEEPQGDIIL